MNFYQKLKKIPNHIALVVIYFYRLILSPTVGILRFLPGYPRPSCIFYPTCSEYGLQSFKKYPFLKALYKTLDRIRRCHPSNEPRVDHP